MSTTLKDWLKQIIAELEEERDATPGAVNEDAAMALAAMKLALASLEAEKGAEPVAKVETVGVCWYADNGVSRKPALGTELFTAPPAPMLPEEMPKGLAGQIVSLLAHNIGDKFLAQKIWNACRAAMLQSFGNSEQLNSPVIPDGWKLVPVELTGTMTNAMTDAILDDLHNVDVWRSVLAAAPQQEVK